MINRPITKLYPIVLKEKQARNRVPVQPNEQPNIDIDVSEERNNFDVTNVKLNDEVEDTNDGIGEIPKEPELFIRDVHAKVPSSVSSNDNRRVRRNAAIMGELQRRLNVE